MSERTLRILVRAPGYEAGEPLEVEEEEHVLIGRNPDWSRIHDPPSAASKSVAVASPSVSANHVRIRRRGERLHVSDLGSRNGTWIAIPPDGEVTAAAGADPLILHLAPFAQVDGTSDAPAAARWTSRLDYVAGLTKAVGAWLDGKDLPSRMTVVDSKEPHHDGVGRVPVATGGDLLIEPVRTVGPGWLDAFARVERYVARQNLLFQTEESMREEGLIVASPAMRQAVARVVDAAAGGARVLLLTGPSGAGKEGLARCFHRHTGRAGPFVARNCAMFSKELVRSELFGAEKGAFTGSVQRIVGAVEMANEGTLFLDELGELPREVQPMLLRFLDHGEYERLGAYGRPKVADVRIIAATNRDLRAASQKDEFRTDLWFRLSVRVVDVPPLRERIEDLVVYLRSFEFPSGKTLLDALGPGTLDLLTQHEWQGNFRELINFAERSRPFAAQGPLSKETAARLLQEGALQAPRRSGKPPAQQTRDPDADVSVILFERARVAFAEDHDGETPRTWDQIKDLVENYVKPLLFAEFSESAAFDGIEGVDLRIAAARLGADRGTALKQLRRFFDRFGESASRRS